MRWSLASINIFCKMRRYTPQTHILDPMGLSELKTMKSKDCVDLQWRKKVWKMSEILPRWCKMPLRKELLSLGDKVPNLAKIRWLIFLMTQMIDLKCLQIRALKPNEQARMEEVKIQAGVDLEVES